MLSVHSFARRFAPSSSSSKAFSTAIYAWGNGSEGQLGHAIVPKQTVVTGTTEIQFEPRKLLNSSKFTTLSAAAEYSLGVTENGELFGWGNGFLGTASSAREPKLIPTPTKVVSVASGRNHSAFIDENGDLFTWGYGGSWHKGGGQLGHGSRDSENAPRLVHSLKEYGVKIAQVSCGEHHTLVLTTDGEVLACGVGENGRLGTGSSEDSLVPTTLSQLVDETIVSIDASRNHSACLTSDGRMFTWGKDDVGQLGHSDSYMDMLYSQELEPRLIEGGIPRMKQISLAGTRSMSLSVDGELFIWGAVYSQTPTVIPPKYFGNMKVTKVAAVGDRGSLAAFAITEDGSLWSFGDYSSNILGYKLSGAQGVGIGRNTTPQKIALFDQAKGPGENGVKVGRVLDFFGGLGKHVFAKVETTHDAK